jgi:hypothetical protein
MQTLWSGQDSKQSRVVGKLSASVNMHAWKLRMRMIFYRGRPHARNQLVLVYILRRYCKMDYYYSIIVHP